MMKDYPLIFVTGSSSGIGKAIVEHLSRFDFRVIASMRKMHQRRDIFDHLSPEQQKKIRLVALDVTQREQREECVDLLRKDYGPSLTGLINNAGFGLFGALEDCSEEQIRRQMEVNFFAPVLLTKQFLPFLRHSGGRILNISSSMGRFSLPQASLYSASKFALEGMSEGLFYELQSVGVQATTLRLGGFKTPFYDSIEWAEKGTNLRGHYFQQTRQMKSLMNLFAEKGVSGKSERMAKIVHYLLLKKKLAQSYDIGLDSRTLAIAQRFLPQRVWEQVIIKGQNYLERPLNI
jgi:short-subunit dehydrogenase